ncbi:MAG: tRNA-dihydrouridine synthase family protein [Lachnospiraceae bacterium]|nr:tRNA-dihydrouridine synthase family protein [Lachnospiraceae bacterium]
MEYYFAPMEGITGYLYRNVHHRHFPEIDRYYMPFISAHASHSMKHKEKEDIRPDNNAGLFAIPQVLTKCAEDFAWTVRELSEIGYREVNLNLGCPSPTVTTKGRGAAFLGRPEELREFFAQSFELIGRDTPEVKISVKTRLGIEDPDEIHELIRLYNEFPICEVIVHARTMREMYNGEAHADVFGSILSESVHPLVYNGNIFYSEEASSLEERLQGAKAVMIGRGLLRNPALVREMKGGERLQISELKSFHDDLFEACREVLPGPKPVLARMKELWWYMSMLFEDRDDVLKRIRRAKTPADLEIVTERVFAEHALLAE